MKRFLLAVVVIITSLFLFSGCLEDMESVRNIKPTELKHYNLKNTYVYGSVLADRDVIVRRIMIYFKNGPDMSLPLYTEYTHFLLDVSLGSTGISRIAVVFSKAGGDDPKWFYKEIPFSLVSNKINYVGVFSVTKDRNLVLTNFLDDDKADFYSNYTSLSKMEFYPVEMPDMGVLQGY